MTVHPNAELLRTTYEAFARGDAEPLLAALTDDIRWEDSTLGPLAGTYNGQSEVRKFFAGFAIYEGTLRVEIVDILANDAFGAVLTRESGTAEGRSATWSGVHLWTFRNGRLARFTSYYDAAYQRFWLDRAPGRPADPGGSP